MAVLGSFLVELFCLLLPVALIGLALCQLSIKRFKALFSLAKVSSQCAFTLLGVCRLLSSLGSCLLSTFYLAIGIFTLVNQRLVSGVLGLAP